MATVISNDRLTKHSVNKYNFKVLAIGSNLENDEDENEPLQKSNLIPNPEAQETATPVESDIDSSAMSNSSKDSLIESLMKKTDEMSSNFIKLQMKLESKEEEYKIEIQKVKEEAFADGVEAGKADASKNSESSYLNGITQLSSSVTTLENSAKEYERALESIKSELITAALDISKEVINLEISKSSSDIAKTLSSELIKELQSASKVVLKVNPKDHGAISEHVGSLAHVEVISDSAVSEGGVIALSDAGNIDSQISKRFDRVKRAALSE